MANTNHLSATASALIETIEREIRADAEANSAILLAEWLARFLFTNYCGIYSFTPLEDALASRFDAVAFAGARAPVLNVASELYPHGGHTRLMKNLLACMKADERETVVTRAARREDVAALLHIGIEEVTVFPHVDEVSKVIALAEHFVQYDRLVLHLHPDDVTAAVAVAVAKKSHPGLRVYFVNHSDHTFSVAVGAADRVLELSAYGLSLAKARGIEGRNSFMGIPIAPAPAPDATRRPDLILTGGSAYKFKPDNGRGLQSAFAQLLDADRTVCVVAVGPQPRDYWWWTLKLRFPTRVRTMTRIPYDKYLELLSGCGLYVDSYPVTGGTAFTEALMRGANVSGISGGPNGYGIADRLRRMDTVAFVAHCQALLRNDARAVGEQAQVRHDAIRFHALDTVQERFRQTVFADAALPAPAGLQDMRFDYDFQSNWHENDKLIAVGFRTVMQLRLLPRLLSAMHTAGTGPTFILGSLARALAARLRLRHLKEAT